MKKFFLLALAVATGTAAFAQRNSNGIGVNAVYATDADLLGLGIKLQHQFNNPFRLEAEADIFFPEAGHYWGLNFNGHYLFNLAPGANVYPLVGLNYTNVGWKGNSDGKLGVNLGGGVEYNISSNLIFNFEAKYQTGDYSDQGILNAGLIYRF